jgi:hypothetical protein
LDGPTQKWIVSILATLAFGTAFAADLPDNCNEAARNIKTAEDLGAFLQTHPACSCDAHLVEQTLKIGTPDAFRAFLLARPSSACAPMIRRALIDFLLRDHQFPGDQTPDRPAIYP